MVNIGDRFLLLPAHCPEDYGHTVNLVPGTVVQLHPEDDPRWALVKFPNWVESFPLFGSDGLEDAGSRYVKRLR